MKFTLAAASAAAIMGSAVVANDIASVPGQRLRVSHLGWDFDVTHFSDGRTRPYTIEFVSNEVEHGFLFRGDGSLQIMHSGLEAYRVMRGNDGILGVARMSSRNRDVLLGGDHHSTDGVGMYDERQYKHHSGFACEDCGAVWKTVCESRMESGVGSICALDVYFDVIGKQGQDGIVTMCDIFGDACDTMTAEAACYGQCQPGEVDRALEIVEYRFSCGRLPLSHRGSHAGAERLRIIPSHRCKISPIAVRLDPMRRLLHVSCWSGRALPAPPLPC